MRSVYVELPTSHAVQSFVSTITGLQGDFELISGRYILDARSLMGIFSLDLEHPIELKVYNDSEENMKAIAPFVVQK